MLARPDSVGPMKEITIDLDGANFECVIEISGSGRPVASARGGNTGGVTIETDQGLSTTRGAHRPVVVDYGSGLVATRHRSMNDECCALVA